jgi:hypothetical protein
MTYREHKPEGGKPKMLEKHEPALRAGMGASAAGRPGRHSFFFLLLTLALALAVSMAAFAGEAEAKKKKKTKPFTKISTVAQSGDTTVNANAADITGITPFTFSNTSKIRSLDQIAIQLTIDDGDTGSGDLDQGDLFLELDGINTEIKLNGFRNNQTDTRTITGTLDPGKEAQILAALKADGQLAASIKDADADDIDPDTTAGSNNKVSLPATSNTTLVISGRQKK